MRKNKKKSEKPLVYGSIRAEIREETKHLFYENGKTKELTLYYGEGKSFKINPACLTDDLKGYLKIAEPKAEWEHGDRTEPKLLEKIAGIDLISIDQEGKGHVRIKFSGRTISQWTGKMEKIMAWLDTNGIHHGEADGQKACVFKCMTNVEKELPAFFQQ